MYKEKDLIEHSELMELLGYEDERSFKRWCDKQHIPIIKMGLKKYILSQYLTQYIDNQLVIFVKETFDNPQDYLEKLNKKCIKPNSPDVEKTNEQRSKAAKRFLNKLKHEKGSEES